MSDIDIALSCPDINRQRWNEIAEAIEDARTWLDMLAERNKTSHVYDEDTARKIYENIRRYHPEMVLVFQKLIAKNR